MNDRKVNLGHRLQSCLKIGQQIRLTTPSLRKLRQLVKPIRRHHESPIQGPQKPSFFIRSQNKTLSVAAICVSACRLEVFQVIVVTLRITRQLNKRCRDPRLVDRQS
jgi:hypothetical protein